MGFFFNNRVYSSAAPISPLLREMMKNKKVMKEVTDRIFNNSDKPVLFKGQEYIIGRSSENSDS